MRKSFKLTLAAGVGMLAAIAFAGTASADPYFTSNTNGDWTNAEYNDGSCHYSYSHNSSDGETHVNRWGDCSGIAIGPRGEPMPLTAAPVMVPGY